MDLRSGIGVMDLNGDTLPVRVDTDLNFEHPAIKDGSNIRPEPMPLTLTVTVSGLEPGIVYYLYRFNAIDVVPDSNFNEHSIDANRMWKIQIASGSSCTITEEINSNEMAIYHAVKASAP